MTIPDPFVVAICYPRSWWAEPGAFDAAVADLEAISTPDGGRVEVIELPCDEPHERRAARGADPDADWAASQPGLTAETLAGLGTMHAALALDLPADVVSMAPNLQWVQAFGAGSDQFVSCRFDDAGVALTSSAGSNAVGIAEFAIGRIIEHYKRFAEIREAARTETWTPMYGDELAGKTLGLIGFGNICAAVAPRARAFGLRVLACRRSAAVGDVDEKVDGLYPVGALHQMLGECDAVVAAVPDSPETRGLIDTDAIAAMKPGAFFCNVGRGSLVDEAALVAALESGHLAGAALDVASSEPLPAGHPLWSAPNLLLSFHNAAVPAAMFANVHRIFADNVQRFLAGEPLVNRV